MIVKQELINKIKDYFDLNIYETKVWLALLGKGIASAGEVATISGVPRSRTYDVLESLEKKGFIIMKVGKPIKYLAVPPEEVVERVKKKVMEDADTKTMLLEELRTSTVLDELNNLHKQGYDLIEPHDLVGSFKGRKTIHNQMESMIKKAKESVLIMTSSTGLLRKKNMIMESLLDFKGKKLDIKIAAPLTKDNIDVARELSKFAEVKHTTNNSRFCIIDGEKILFMVLDDSNTDSSYDFGIWAETKPFLSTIKRLFDSEWEKMTPLDKLNL